MAGIQEYKCPACGGALEFDSKLQKMKCPYCDSEYDMETLKALDEQLNQTEADDTMEWNRAEAEQLEADELSDYVSYVCKSCGGEIIGTKTEGAMSCPFCGNPVVIMGQFAGMLKPDLVIPFKLDRNQAKEALRNHLKGRPLLPKSFTDENRIDEIKGVYLPFWLYDTTADADVRFKAEKVRSWKTGDTQYTETSFYSVLRGGQIEFENVPVDGSTQMSNILMESIEPFDMRAAVPFQTAYLAGYFAEKYDEDAKKCEEHANNRIRNSVGNIMYQSVSGYAAVHQENASIRLSNSRTRYGLLPVYLLTTSWHGEKYTFAMNGQTGKFVGDLPSDNSILRRKQAIYVAACTAVGVVASLLAYLL